jgi:uncharacterized damage-inducible protein DinB
MASELDTFLQTWDGEAKKTLALLRALPADSYDFRPDTGGRSVGELAWHLAEGDAYTSQLVEKGSLDPSVRLPGLERPREVAALAPGYERVHAEAVERVRRLTADDLGRRVRYFDGSERPIASILWEGILFHHIHHRGQLSVLCRLAGGASPGCFGPNREETAAMKAARASASS